MKTKLITKLTVFTSAVLLLSLLVSGGALVFMREFLAAPDSQREFAHNMVLISAGVLAIQAVMIIFSGTSLFWLRRMKHDA